MTLTYCQVYMIQGDQQERRRLHIMHRPQSEAPTSHLQSAREQETQQSVLLPSLLGALTIFFFLCISATYQDPPPHPCASQPGPLSGGSNTCLLLGKAKGIVLYYDVTIIIQALLRINEHIQHSVVISCHISHCHVIICR